MAFLRRLYFVWMLYEVFFVVIGGGIYTHYRLPTALKPEKYQLKIVTHLETPENFTFHGEVTIRLQVLEDTKNITFHAKNLTLHESQINLKSLNDDHHVCVEGVENVPEHDYCILHLSQNLQSGNKYELQLKFSGLLNENIEGYFLVKYQDERTDETKRITATDFQPTYARMAFPCWDEPNYKAKFTIWLGHNKSLNALSNMPLEHVIPYEGDDNYVWSIFQESVVMAAYLVAYSINDFVSIESKSNVSETEFRVWCRKDKSHLGDYAAEVSPRIHKYFEELLKTPNPLKKIDQIAIPGYPNEGMENWGLVVYAERYLCPEAHGMEEILLKKYLFELLAHELVHQWFGNLITTKWWKDVWIHEGLAKYFSFLATRDLNADCNGAVYLWLHLLKMFNADSTTTTHPLSELATNAQEIHRNFGELSYVKGSIILRMVHIVLGDENFFRAIQQFVNKYQYQNVEQHDLFREFSQKALDGGNGLNMETILDSWTLQSGYPVIKVWRNYENGSLEISQQRFMSEMNLTAEDVQKCWWIPLSYISAKEFEFTNTTIKSWLECDELMNSKPLQLSNTRLESNDWIIFNIQITAFYRVMYDPKNWQLITNTLLSDAYSRIHVLNRAQLVGDALTLACSGHQEYDIAFGILEYLKHEYESPPWKSAWFGLESNFCASILKSLPKNMIYYKAFMRHILQPIFNRSRSRDIDFDLLNLYGLKIHWVDKLELQNHSQSHIALFRNWTTLPHPDVDNPIPPSLRDRIYCDAIKYGNISEWDFLWKHFQNLSSDNKERKTILQSLNCTNNENLVRNYLDIIFNNETLLTTEEEKHFAFMALINNEIGLRLAREFCVKNINELYTKTDVNILFDRMASKIISLEDLNTHIHFIQTHREYFENVDEKVQLIRENYLPKVQWIDANADKIISYLEKSLTRMGINISFIVKGQMSFLWRLYFIWLLCEVLLVVIGAGIYTHYRLPTALKPETYHLKILTHLETPENFTFNGEVSIRLQVLEDTKNITFHAKNLTLHESQIDLKNLNDDLLVCVEGVEKVPEHDYCILHLCQKLERGVKYELQLKFSGLLNENIQGYFLVKYQDERTGETKRITATDFQPTYARMAFPCWDEPNYKAKFTILLGHNKSLNALSNMPLTHAIPYEADDNYVWSIFQESVVMSTYLVAYSINDFVPIESKSNVSETEFRVWCRKDKSHLGSYAAEVSPGIHKYFEDLLKTTNPLKKIDQIAIPGYPNEGMENWGLVVYAESYLCLESHGMEAIILKKYLFELIAHELVHQWFGNLITTKWWKDIWIHEGFAKYFSYLATKDLNADYNDKILFWINFLEIFDADSKTTSRPLSELTTNAQEINQNFDVISYVKGCMILRMVHIVLGQKNFFLAIQQFVNKHQYQNIEQHDLFREFSQKSLDGGIGLNMETILDSWTLQSGYPVIKVWRNYENGSLEISQQRFMSEMNLTAEDVQKCWWIPLSYTSSKEFDFTHTTIKSWLECDELMNSKPLQLNDTRLESNEWIIFNIQITAFYRVMYDPQNWQLITNTLLSEAYSRIHVLNRAQLVGDALALACSGHQEYDTAFGILEYLKHEYEYPPWKSAWFGLESNFCASILKSLPKYMIYYKAFMRHISEPIFNNLRSRDIDLDLMNLFRLKIDWVDNLESQNHSQSHIALFKNWTTLPHPDVDNPIPPSLRDRIYCDAIKYGNIGEWNFLWKRFQNLSTDNKERKTILQALNCTNNENLLTNYLDIIFNNETLLTKEEEKHFAFLALINNEIGLRLAREFCVKNINELYTKTDVNILFDRMASKIISLEDLNTHIHFIETHREYFENVNEKVRFIRENYLPKVQWIDANADKIISYLEKRLSRMGLNISNEIY
ncbi:putative aminopeptidase-2 [Musca autumnalis]|uniref:putative aminopeptidase-2 n=1 Tax=Musca autumnalis TaxID=221902 RepID=UPI003CF17B74